MGKRHTTEEFIKKARKIHGDKYDYSKVNYVHSMINIFIKCFIHGIFHQTPIAHLSGHGCHKCGRNNAHKKVTSTTQSFIEKARKIHGDKYDYSKVKYVLSKIKVIIGCPIHGWFKQSPMVHLQTKGCPKCGIIGRRYTITEFIEKARKIHGDKYDYSKVKYKTCRDNIIIGCPIHGWFKTKPKNHIIDKTGCQQCVYDNIRSSIINFIKNARKIHGDKYDYSKVKYINANTCVIIKCPIHGCFRQQPANHVTGKSGCPKCRGRHISKKEIKFLNHIKVPNKPTNRQVKLHRYKVDGYIKKYNTVYEFLGDYWHGNPTHYHKKLINKHCKQSFGNLHNKTFERFDNIIKNTGCTLKYIWECDWDRFVNNNSKYPKIYNYKIN